MTLIYNFTARFFYSYRDRHFPSLTGNKRSLINYKNARAIFLLVKISL